MGKKLIQLPNDASTSKYPKTFPQPLNLLCYYDEGDELIDLAADCFEHKKDLIRKVLIRKARELNTLSEDVEIIINAGDYPADAEYSYFFELFFSKMIKPATVIGTYSKIYPEKITRYSNLKIDDSDLSYPNYGGLDFRRYPQVGGKFKLSIRASTGCPRSCKMCPVKKCFNGYEFLDVDEIIQTIRMFYDKGVRYVTFIDDNLIASSKFLELAEKLKKEEFNRMSFHCQEGFDLGSFSNEIAYYLKELNFDDIKIAFENINPNFIANINKPHITPERIDNVLNIIKANELSVKAFFLMGLDEFEEDILENIKFFAKNNMTIRANIIRNYGINFVDKFKRKITDDRLKELKALAYATSFFTDMGINIFDINSFESVYDVKRIDGKIEIYGKTKFGFQTSRFETGIKYIYKLPIIKNDGKRAILGKTDKTKIGFGVSSKEIDENAKGINMDSLRKSRDARSKFLNKFGTIPQSILIADRTDVKKRMDIITDEMGGGAAGYQKERAKKYKKEGVERGLEKTGFVMQGRTKYEILSAFPQNIGRIIVDIYCPENGLVYDPFCGHNSRMELVFKMGRSYIGVDICKRFMEANRKIRDILLEKRNHGFISSKNKNTIELIEGSSAKVDLPDNFADFTITSPPYYNVEYYGPEEEQLGNAKTYDEFLLNMYDHVAENFRILKPGAFSCWFINDFRQKGVFYPYHIDLYTLFINAGFEPFNIYIVDLGWPANGAFVYDIVEHKLLAKRHEYCLVFKKTGEK